MKKYSALVFVFGSAFLLLQCDLAVAQDMRMASHTLLLAQLDGAQVVPASGSDATGTGAFLLDPRHHILGYQLTYQGVVSGAKAIVLRNFGKGANGPVIGVLCGEGARPCPSGAGATISGSIDRAVGRPFDNPLVSEFDSERVYVELTSNSGKAEIRGQLSPNSAMVPVSNFVAHLAPAEGAASRGTGTAILSEVRLPDGKVSVFYAATVADTAGTPLNAALVGVPARPVPRARAFTLQMALPELKLKVPRNRTGGGSFDGLYNVDTHAANGLFATRILALGNKEVGIVVTTSRFPNGELYGAFEPVR